MIKAIATAPGQATKYVPLTVSEQIAREQEEEVVLAAEPRRNILKQIIELENQMTPRRMREHALGIGGTFLSKLETQIVALRSQL